MRRVLFHELHAGAYIFQSSIEPRPKHLSIYDAIGMDAHKQHIFSWVDLVAPSDKNTGRGSLECLTLLYILILKAHHARMRLHNPAQEFGWIRPRPGLLETLLI